MAVEAWLSTTLGEVIELKRGYDLPSRDRHEGPYPIVSSSGISGYHAKAMAKAPGVVTGRYGTLGEVYFIVSDFWPLNTSLYVRDFKGNDPRFISYFLRTIDYFAYSDKAAVPGLNRNHLHAAPVVVPPLTEQRAIAAVLGALDDKIELNRKMARVLEGIARAVFTSWFVDFDPVRAKAAGRDPGLPKPIADLFPSRLVDSPIGEVPEGWRVERLDEVCTFEYGRAMKADDRTEGPVPVFGSNGQIGWHNSLLVAGPGIIVGRKGNPGIVTWVEADFFPIDTTFYVVLSSSVNKDYLYYLYWSLMRLGLPRLAADSAVPGLNRNMAYGERIATPDSKVVSAFESFTQSLRYRMGFIARQSDTLAALRDALLPILISGEIRIPDATRIVFCHP